MLKIAFRTSIDEYSYLERSNFMDTLPVETNNKNNKIDFGKMQFEVVNQYPDTVEHDMKELVEQQLYNIFKKYDIKK
jgi:hypothetical protein